MGDQAHGQAPVCHDMFWSRPSIFDCMDSDSKKSMFQTASQRGTEGFARDLQFLLQFLSPKRKLQLCIFVILSLMTVMAEMVTLGSLVPFLAIMFDPSQVDRYPRVAQALQSLGFAKSVLAATASLLAVIVLIAALVRLIATWFGMRFSYGLGSDLASDVYRRTLHRPYEWHIAHNTSDVLAGVDKANQVTTGIIIPITNALVALLTALGILVILLLIDTRTAIAAGVGFASVYALMTRVLGRKVSRNGAIVSKNATLRVRAIQEGLGGIRDVLLDGSQSVYHRRFAAIDYEQKRAQASNGLMAALPRHLIESAGVLLIIGLAFWLNHEEGGLQQAIPVLGALAFGAQKLMPHIQTVYQSLMSIQGHRKQLFDVLGLLKHPMSEPSVELPTRAPMAQNQAPLPTVDGPIAHEVRQPTGESPGDLHPPKPVVEFCEVGYRYREELAPALTQVNLVVHRGDRVGFVGETGSGKSTLIDLIMALLTPTHGKILIDGEELGAGNRRQWQRRIAHVPQSIYLSDASVAENIAFGVPSGRIDMTRVRLAAERAQIAEFVDSMPKGFRSAVGERGIRLSGGQRQRIGLARALYKGADILVLDEATSALDDATEKSVMQAVNALDRNLTVFMIAHRLSTLSDCNSIYRLHHGRATHLGGFDALIKASANPL